MILKIKLIRKLMFKVYTDGSCSPNPGAGGAGAVLIKGDKIVKELIHAGGETTNNRMELYALIMSFEYIPKDNDVIMYTDSQYVMKGINEWIHNWVKRGWLTAAGGRVKNADLWKQLLKLTEDYPNVTIEWVKAHNGNKWNERADTLANIGTSRSKGAPEPDEGINLLNNKETNEITSCIEKCDYFISKFDNYKKILIKSVDTERKKQNLLAKLQELQIYIEYLNQAQIDIETRQ
jgi:ribonuclease HI